MANHKSAIKRQKQIVKASEKNSTVKGKVKTSIKRFKSSLSEKNLEMSKELLSNTIPLIQKAASKGVIHKKNASRKISRLTRGINRLTS